MVDTTLALSLLQLVALALPAFAILLEVVVNADVQYTHFAVPVTTAGLGAFLVGGVVILAQLVATTASPATSLAMGLFAVGMLCMLVGAGVIGFYTRQKQHRALADD